MKKLFCTAAILLATASCAKDGKFVLPELGFEKNWQAEEAETNAPKAYWWKDFNDAQLNQLIDSAINNNFDVKIAQSRILQARASRTIAEAALYPQVDVKADASRTKSPFAGGFFTGDSKPLDLYEAGFDAIWELDIFGQNKAKEDAAGFDLKSTEAKLQAVKLTLVAEIINNYLDLRSAQSGEITEKKNILVQEENLRMLESLQKSGLADSLKVTAAKNTLTSAKASLPDILATQEATRNRLVTLSGLSAKEIADIANTEFEDKVNSALPALGQPANVILNRPDVVAAQNNLLSAMASKNAAELEYFPKISLGAFFGIADTSLTKTDEMWKIGTNLTAPLLNFSKIEANANIAGEREKQALEEYKKTVAAAVEEVKTAISNYLQQHASLELAKQRFENAKKQTALMQERQSKGLNSMLDVNNLKSQEISTHLEVDLAASNFYKRLTALYKALGTLDQS